MSTVSSRTAARVVAAAADRGVDPAQLCRAVGIDRALLDDVDARVRGSRYAALWDLAVAELGNPAFPFEVASDAGDPHNLLRFVCMTCSTLRQAMDRASRFLGVLTDSVTWPVTHLADRVSIGIQRPPQVRPDCRVPDEFGIAEIVVLARAFTGVDFVPLEVRFAHAAPPESELAVYRDHFRSPLRFLAPRSEVDVPVAAADLPLARADESMRRFLEHMAQRQLPPEREQPPTAADLVRSKLERPLCGETPTIEEIADELGMSARTLRRRLQGEGVSFRSLLEETRFAMAERHLARGDMSTPELAFILGFSETSAFHRAFKRWSQMTPRRFAERLRT